MRTSKFLQVVSLAAIFWGFSVNKSIAQWCGSDQMWYKQVALHPEIELKADQLERFTRDYVRNYQSQMKASKRVSGTPDTITYIIPIVFHILHQYGPEDISDAEVFDEMRILNEDYAKLNPDTIAIATPHFKKIASNTKIQWRLAQIDPKGNCTNGIDRIYTYLTNNANDQSKLNQWDPTKYMNVWVCKSIYQGGSDAPVGGTILGYAYFPSAVDNIYMAPYDGVLINYQCIGSIGAAYTGPGGSWDRCLSHELGHTLNLEHPWGLTNSPGVACGDDAVYDTPVTQGYFSICPADSNGAKKCDTAVKSPLYIVTENWQNYMDYSFCSNMFTLGQAERMWAALNFTQAGRNNLWTKANLIATGVDTTLAVVAEDSAKIEHRCAPYADFYSNTCMVCQGSKVDFTDASWNAEPTNWLWTFSGANIATSTARDPIVTYDSLYWQNISLTSSNLAGSSSKTKNQYVFVSPSWTNYSGGFSDDFEDVPTFQSQWIVFNNANDRSFWQVTSAASYTGHNSLFLNSYGPAIYFPNTNPPEVIVPAIWIGSIDDAVSPSVSFKYVKSSVLTFEYSCATGGGLPTESLTVSYSTNCGQTWTLMKTITGAALATAGQWATGFTPTSRSEWALCSINVPAIVYGKSNVRFRFEYTSGPQSNNIYIDDVNLSGDLGINALAESDYNVSVYPNPTNGSTNVDYVLPKDQHIEIVLTDIVGHILTEVTNNVQSAGHQHVVFNNNNLADGMYFVKVIADNNTITTKKLVVAH